MILSDEEIKTSNAPYHVFKDSHIEANARIRELESGICHQVLAFVRAATEGRVSALAESFPVVRAVADLWHEKRCLEMRLEDCRLDAEGVAVYIHEATNAENRADRLAVIADALAGELQYIFDYWQEEEIRIGKAKGDLMHKELSWCIERSDLRERASRTEAKLRELREVIERNQKDLPQEFSRLVDDHFWELV